MERILGLLVGAAAVRIAGAALAVYVAVTSSAALNGALDKITATLAVLN